MYQKIVQKEIIVSAYENTTVWEFKDAVSRLLGLGPNYTIMIIHKDDNKKSIVHDREHGKTLADLKITSDSAIDIERIPYVERV